MNKRQAKKAFKKKYGMTPKEASKAVENIVPSLQDACDSIVEVFNRLGYAIRKASNSFYEALEKYDKGESNG